MIRAGVVGATGYTGFEILRILARHPEVELIFATARRDAGKQLSDLFPTPIDVRLQAIDEVDPGSVDILLVALPHGAAAGVVATAIESGTRVIDLSADFRLNKTGDYLAWYGETHPAPALLDTAVYGLTEWRREAIRGARLVANPGCYPTALLLATAPLLASGLLDGATIIADSKSGVSGAGRSARVGSLFAEVDSNLKPYQIGHSHRHVAEIEQEMDLLAGERAPRGVVFSPHLLPVTRGILSTIYLPMPEGVSLREVREQFNTSYAKEAFIWLLPEGDTATLAHTAHTTRCAISIHPVPERNTLILVSTIDNLIKGAAGQAVQNMNVMFGIAETTALL